MEKDQWRSDLELIFQQAMSLGQLSIALKAKELLGKSWGLLGGGKSMVIKPIRQWSIPEMEDFLAQLEQAMKEKF